MTKVRPAKSVRRQPDHWEVSDTFRPEGNHPLVEGREVSITGERGRFIFLRHVLNNANGAEWIDVAAPRKGGIRSFDPSRIRTVHSRTAKLRESQ